ncbi:MAG: radical SAM protein [bacterium]
MRLFLINPHNASVTSPVSRNIRWNRFFIAKPLSLMILAGVTPSDWEIRLFDENVTAFTDKDKPKPDLVGITVMTPQAPRAYEIARSFREIGVPVVLGGSHVTIQTEEALQYADSVVQGEADIIWPQVLEDARRNVLKRIYVGDPVNPDNIASARHDLLPMKYATAPIQITRGCQLKCTYCSVSLLNGQNRRHRTIGNVIQELKTIREKNVLIVDENLIGVSKEDIAYAKELFTEMIKANIRKTWRAWTTINMADDEELLALAAQAGCSTIIIGFETTTRDGLLEIGKQFNTQNGRDIKASVGRIQKHKILVYGSFLIGLDCDRAGVGRQIADVGNQYGLDFIGVSCLTPYPGTRLWEKLDLEKRITANTFPKDWGSFTLHLPVIRCKHLSAAEIQEERKICNSEFYSLNRILYRIWLAFLQRRNPLLILLSNLRCWFKFNRG